MLTVLALVALACNCAPLINLAGEVDQLINAPTTATSTPPSGRITPEFTAPPLPEGAPAYPTGTGPATTADVEGNLPVHDGGDGLNTIFVQPIDVGETVEAAFGATTEAHNWVFEGRSGMQIRAFTELPAGAETDPLLALIGPGGEVLATSDDVDGYNPAVEAQLDARGLYTLRVTTWWPGPYTLTLAR